MHFAPLNIHSGYSFLQSGIDFEAFFNALKKKYYYFAGLCDVNSLHGIPEFINYAKKYEISPLLGVTATFTINGEMETIVLYILNDDGYHNLCLLSPFISRQEITFDLLKKHSEGLAIVLPSYSSHLQKHLQKGTDRDLALYLLSYAKIFPVIYLGIELPTRQNQTQIEKLRLFADKYNYQCLAFPLILYLEKEHAITLRIVEAIQNEKSLDITEAEGQDYLRSFEEITSVFTDAEINATVLLTKMSTFNFSQKRGTLLRFPLPNETTSKDHLFFLTHSRLHELGKNVNDYLSRLDYELEIINKMGYNDYFLIVQDYVEFAKKSGIIVGPGRGSAAGSLVSYLLDITTIDPLQYGLLFERFLNPTRITMPDIDIDFADTRREEIIDYLRNKYGAERVANIVTFQTIGAKQALRDIGRIYGYPLRDIDLLTKSIQYQNITLKEAYRNVPAFKDLVDSDKYFLKIVSLANKIEGLPRQSGMHAAGIIINDEPIMDVMPVTIDGFGHHLSQYEMGFLEEQGFLKMDLLGLRNLTLIDNIVRSINDHHLTYLKPMDLPYDEPEIFDLIANNQTMGIFQLETAGMKKSIQILKPNSFEDVVALIALFRPGPMDNIPLYARRKHGLETVEYEFSELQKILSPTYGTIIYQEQIISIVTAIASFSLADADIFRRAISKKDAQKLNELKQLFLSGALKNGHPLEKILRLYDLILKFADYGFNRSHSVAYAIISCQMTYLKVHYPLEFYVGILDSSASINDYRFAEYLSEIRARKIKISPPNINLSTRNFLCHNESLVFPLSFVKGLNSNIIAEIIKIRDENGRFTSLEDFLIKIRRLQLNNEQITRLINAGAFDEISPSRETLRKSLTSLLQYVALFPLEDATFFDPSVIPHPPLVETKEDSLTNLRLEEEALGITLSSSPLAIFRQRFIELGYAKIAESSIRHGAITIAGIVKSRKVITTKKGTNMAFLTLMDEDSELEVVVFPSLYDSSHLLLEKQRILIISGRFNFAKGNFIADIIRVWEEH